jgi:transitional endoplasmic reticulum ATPase
VKELFERARGRAPCILFVDEIEAVAPVRGGSNADQFTNEIVNQFLQELDGVRTTDRHVFLLAATNIPDAIDPAVLSRFGDRIEIPRPDEPQRTRLFRLFLGKQRTDFDVDEVAAMLARRHDGLSGREIGNIVKNASQLAVRRAIRAGTPEQVMLTRTDFDPAPAAGSPS